MQISTAFEFVRATTPAAKPQNISFTYTSHPHERTDQTAGTKSWNTHVNCMKCSTWTKRIHVYIHIHIHIQLYIHIHHIHPSTSFFSLRHGTRNFPIDFMGCLVLHTARWHLYWHFIKLLHCWQCYKRISFATGDLNLLLISNIQVKNHHR